jgi:hypothetical protein
MISRAAFTMAPYGLTLALTVVASDASACTGDDEEAAGFQHAGELAFARADDEGAGAVISPSHR